MNKSEVIILNENNFQKLVFDSKKMWMIKFVAPWCYWCKRLENDWKEAAKSLKGLVNFGEVDCTKEKNIAKKYRLRGYPTIMFFYKSNKNTMIYKGERKSTSLIKYAIKKKKMEENLLKM